MKPSQRRKPQPSVPPERHDTPFPLAMWCAAIFGLAFLVRALHDWEIRGAPFFSVLLGDAKGYDEWARRLAAGD